MDKFRELSASLKENADELRRDGVYGCCAGTYRHAAAQIDAILRESEAPVPVAGAVEEWLDRDWPLWRNDPDHPTVQRIRRAWDAAQASQAALAASATPRTEPTERRRAVAKVAKCAGTGGRPIFLWTYPGGLHGFLGDHPIGTKLYAAPPADGGARVTVQAHEPTMFGPNDAWDPADAARVTDWIVGDGLGGIKAEAHFLTTHDDDRVKRAGTRLLERADKIITALAAREGGAK